MSICQVHLLHPIEHNTLPAVRLLIVDEDTDEYIIYKRKYVAFSAKFINVSREHIAPSLCAPA